VWYFVFKNKAMVKTEKVLDYAVYPKELDTIKMLRVNLRNKQASFNEIQQTFLKAIDKRVFKYWYGTEWDFNGTTQKPHEGKIACGYFVTTTLRDMGVPINRVKMAQCASEEMINSLTTKKNIYHFSSISLSDFEKKITKKGNGLYIIGLDNHTGFISISDKGNYFIHASGWFPFQVIKEVLGKSSILSKSKYRVVGKISDDETFLRKWLNKED
jgi:hypothetical protein